MPRTCTVCTHLEREAVDKALVAGELSFRRIAAQFSLSEASVRRHKAEHLPASMVKAREAQEEARSIDVMAELGRCFVRVNLLFDACDRWLRDPEDPARYEIGPRAEDVSVTYTETGADGKPRRHKAKLSTLLAKAAGAGVSVEWAETKYADPRELVLKTAGQLQGQIELLAKLVGKLDERPQVNVLLAPEWVEVRLVLLTALQPFPEAKAAVARRLQEVEGNGHRV